MKQPAFVILMIIATAMVAAAQNRADLVLVNGKIFTSDPSKPRAEALAIRRDRIQAVGNNGEIRTLAGERTRIIDLAGRSVVPGFNDAHAHFGPNFQGIDLTFKSMEPTWAEVVEALKAEVAGAPNGKWIFGTIGGSAINSPLANRKELD